MAADVGPAFLEELRGTLRGEVLAPADPGYESARRVWNAMVDKRPGVIARCASAEDVAAAISLAVRADIEVAVRSGGHSISGASSSDGGIVIDLTRMRDVHVDPDARVATVSGGALLRHMDAETQRFGLATTAGMVSHTGVGGLTLGGGYGYLSRRFGLTCDNLLSAEVVLADGSVVVVSETDEPELLWGLRGGGGNFGVVTTFRFRLHPVGPTVIVGELTYSEVDGAGALRAFRDLVFDRHDVVSAVHVGAVSPSWPGFERSMVGKPVVIVEFVVTGTDLDDADRIAASLRGAAPVIVESVEPMPYVELQSAGDTTSAPGAARRYWKSSAFAALPDELLETFLERGVETASVAPDCYLELVAAFGGAVSTIGADETAFGQRRAQVDFLALGRWTDPADDERFIELCRANWAAVSRFGSAGVYVNNLGREDRVLEAYGESRYRRLAALKHRFDPANIFHLNANIRPSGGSGAARTPGA